MEGIEASGYLAVKGTDTMCVDLIISKGYILWWVDVIGLWSMASCYTFLNEWGKNGRCTDNFSTKVAA